MRQDATAWWKGATIYQIYPRSFFDTTGNGTGDLRGITEKLDHVASLGVDAIWISPFVRSPMKDFGYDVSDYRAVDPLFGSDEDFHHLLEAAHERGLKVLMDQVLSHTSDQHPWFQESRKSRDNPKADWYVWANADETGQPPNNWLSVFGGPAWQWNPWRGQYYLHNFLREQPDLNFHNPEVRQAVLDACKHWLDLGVDGFRLDVCAFYTHDPELKDNPPDPNPPTGSHFMFNPYVLQRHVNDIGQPSNVSFLEELRALTDRYEDRVLLGELHQENGIQLHKDYTAPGRLHLAYGYWLLGAEHLDAPLIRKTAEDLGHGDSDGWPCWALDNHDFDRSPSRLGCVDRPEVSFAWHAAILSMRGAACIYQGAELGLPHADVPYHRMVDPYGIEFYPSYKGRDGSRTPMPWTHDRPHAGFSEAEPWLPVPPEHMPLSVDCQQRTPGSLLNHFRTFLAWRRTQPGLLHGGMAFLDGPEKTLCFTRPHGEEGVLCLFNLGDETAEFDLSALPAHEPLEGHGFGAHREGDILHLPGWQGYYGRLS